MDRYHYYVEGETEEKLTRVLKTEYQSIMAGKIQILDVTKSRISDLHLMQLKTNTVVILIFDTDTDNIHMVKENIKKLEKSALIKKIILIPQVQNLEEELIYSCEIKSIKDLINCRSDKDFKRDLLALSDKVFVKNLNKNHFDVKKLWARDAEGVFSIFRNEAYKIKKNEN